MILAFGDSDKWLEVIRHVLQNGAGELEFEVCHLQKGTDFPNWT